MRTRSLIRSERECARKLTEERDEKWDKNPAMLNEIGPNAKRDNWKIVSICNFHIIR